MKCAVYVRVSTDKEEQKTSLKNQKEMFVRYIAKNGWDLYNIYTDIQSGTKDKKRPEFNRMMSDAKEKKFDIILAKELSRLARNGLLSYKIKDIAMQNDIELITLDNAINTIEGNDIMFGTFASHYENESKNTSRRVKEALDNRARNGLFKGSIPPLGYRLEKGKFYVREDNTPDVVKRIFREYLTGCGQDIIARRLWKEGIQTPSEVAGKINSSPVWHGSSVMKILRNRMYIGDMVQGKTETKSVTSDKRRINKIEDYIVVENIHKAIITKEEFYAVQELIKTRCRIKSVTQTHLFSNLLFCADCGKGFHFKANRKGYVCGSYDKRGKSACTDHIVREKELSDTVLQDIKTLIDKILKNKDLSKDIENKIRKKKQKGESEIKKIEKELAKYKKRKVQALNNLMDNIITKEDYNMYTEEINSNLGRLTKKQQEYLTLAKNDIDTNNIIRDVQRIQEEVLNIKELSQDIINKLIEKIEVKEDKTIRIYYRFAKPFQDL